MKIYNIAGVAFVDNLLPAFIEDGFLEIELVNKEQSGENPHLSVRENGCSNERFLKFADNKIKIKGLERQKSYELVLCFPQKRIHVAKIHVCDGGSVADYVVADVEQQQLLSGLIYSIEEIAILKKKLESHMDGAEII